MSYKESLMKLPRRAFLRAAGVSLALPWLDAFAAETPNTKQQTPKRRMVCICSPLGIQPQFFFPQKAGKDYELSPYLNVIKEFRNDFTVVSGLAHPGVGPSHDSHYSFLTAAPHPEHRAGFRNSISLDQRAAVHVRGETRFTTLNLGSSTLGWTTSGAPVPADPFPTSVFTRLFIEGRPDEVEAQKRRLRNGKSILDSLREQSKKLRPALSGEDREKMDQYFSSIRELEQCLAQAEEWSRKPKPDLKKFGADTKPPAVPARSDELVARAKAWFHVVHLALLTDSTRLITLDLGEGSGGVAGVSVGHHDLTHNGRDPGKIEQLKKLELAKMEAFRGFLAKLQESKEDGASLLDRTMVFFSSNLGDASTHGVKSLPVLLAGGGFKHGQYLDFPEPKDKKKDPTQPPLSNLYLSMLHRLGINTDKFGSSTGTLPGLEMRSA
jgi:hypothetical protein